MKYLLLSVFYFILCIPVMLSQTPPVLVVEGGCNSISEVSYSRPDGSNLYVDSQFDGGPHLLYGQDGSAPCNLFFGGGPINGTGPRYFLQKFDYSSNSWNATGGYQYTRNFTSVADGTYRVAFDTLFVPLFPNCDGQGIPGPARIFNSAQQVIGFRAQYAPTSIFSNTVIVGETEQNDINAVITDVSGVPTVNFDDNDQVILDLSDCTNFDRYRIAIQQVTGSNNYQSGGWQIGTPTSINLNDIWTQNFSSWKFWSNRRFRVQVTLDNQDCQNGVWNEKFYFFDTCSGGANTCRFTENTELDVFPNPATDMFIVRNLDLSKANRYDLMITDVTGRMIRNERLTGSQVDVSDLNPGLYIVRINAEGEKVMQSKVVMK